jgi:hypothetical protein
MRSLVFIFSVITIKGHGRGDALLAKLALLSAPLGSNGMTKFPH